MQITLYVDGRQVVSNDADVRTTAENVRTELGDGAKSVPMGAAMFMIYSEGDNGINVSAIVSELTFSNKPVVEPVKEAEPVAQPAPKAEPVAQPEKKVEPVKAQQPAKQQPVAKPKYKPTASQPFRTVQKPVAKPQPAQQVKQQPAKPVQQKPAAPVQKPQAEQTQTERTPRTRHYSV